MKTTIKFQFTDAETLIDYCNLNPTEKLIMITKSGSEMTVSTKFIKQISTLENILERGVFTNDIAYISTLEENVSEEISDSFDFENEELEITQEDPVVNYSNEIKFHASVFGLKMSLIVSFVIMAISYFFSFPNLNSLFFTSMYSGVLLSVFFIFIMAKYRPKSDVQE